MRETSPDPFHAVRNKLVALLLMAAWLVQLSFSGLNVPMLLLSSVLLLMSLFVAYMRGAVVNPLNGRAYLPWLMLLILLWLAFTPYLSAAPYRSWLYGWLWLALPVVFFISVQFKKINSDRLCLIIPLSGALLAVISIYQFHLMQELYGFRASGTLLDPNSYAGLINLLMLPSLGWLLLMNRSNRPLQARVQWLSLFLMAGGICSTGSRAGIMIMVAGIVLLTIAAWRRGGRPQVGLIALGICALWIAESMLLTDGALTDRLRTISLYDPSVSARFLIWQSGWELIQQAPWWGYGIGTFALLYPKTRSVYEGETTGGYMHSDPLQLLLEGGWPLLLLVSAVVAYAVVYLFKLFRGKGEVDIPLVAFALAVLLAAAHACVNFNFYNVSILSVVALYLAIIYLNFHGQTLSPIKNTVVKATAGVTLSVLVVGSSMLLLMDYQAGELQKPLMTKGLQASFTDGQCEQAGLLSSFRPTMPGLAMVEGVCALKKNSCIGVNEAMGLFGRAIDTSSLQPELYAFVAQLELLAGQCIAGAEADARLRLLQALEQNPSFFPARYLLYSMDMQAGKVKEAKAWIIDGLNYGMHINDRNKLIALTK